MPTDRYTNATQHGRVLAGTQITRPAHAPYAARGSWSNLTPKEKEARRQNKTASTFKTADYGGGLGTVSGGNTMLSGTSSFFSPQLSTDFLELPQSLREKREIYRHFYNTDPLVGQAIDLHTELPLSKVRLSTPKPRTCPEGFKSADNYGKYILSFFEKMCKRTKLFQRLITATHHYWLDGNVFIFAEDGAVDVPEDVTHEFRRKTSAVLDEDGVPGEVEEVEAAEYPDAEDRELAYFQKHYKGWDRLVIIPIDQVKLTTFNFTDKVRVEMIPSERDRQLVKQAAAGDEVAQEMVSEIPGEVRDLMDAGHLIPLGTDPDEGSFVYHLSGRRGAGEELGASILDRCLRTLYYREKLRQAQTQIASRAMTPKRIVWGENLDEGGVEDLREQVDLALVDPDYSIVTNYEVHWEEMGSRDRLLDLSSEYEQTDKQLFAGLGVTESLLNGESTFAGDRVKLEVLNTRYLLFRETLQEYVEEYLFKPVARRKGFVELDEWGEEVVLYPKLSFTRLALRDSQDTFDALLNLYQKGSVSIDLILEMFNIDPMDTREKIERDMFTVNDALFNEVVRAVYGEVGRMLAEKSNIGEKLAKYLGLEIKEEPPAEEAGRF
jgi:hypothetical protein